MQFYRPFSAPKALTFDLDDTLYDNRPVIRRAEQSMHDWLAVNHPRLKGIGGAGWLQLKKRLAKADPMLRHNVTQWRFELLKIGFMQLGYSLSAAEQAAGEGVAVVLEVRNQVDVPAETHRVLAMLKQQLPLVAITNGNVDAEKIGLAQYFDGVLMAGRDGLAKPEPDLFVSAAVDLGIPPSDILHIGDHLVTDVGGAKQNGFKACWFNDQLRVLSREPRAKWLPDVEISQLSQLLALVSE
ncbi:5-amino-6-(5-phospho-D-ribitylamino)uracil phosphatase YigB [Photobacterium sp. ZSDE20]|uniref:5-amino-6-(5-phospho-D-ribitylamino)uracil phosphatase YigB n=1 Tax=Photobacterium pectinilyticum TaxID=2906793 RepID=A0ABT1MZI2_9GAMM|nr:5-amino-6-(5-phospho-D-ribitylamino)uracil phosphatase YigB [Photobacterium sp. ZSDE20]MCQ1057893.1 5-amino-6-(5-phospho-D-ribitylamino)uracil phosphatase YigB [Photobacterium sp. ZSDE20]MDD1822425.1 5-amino-6-(5-phospho-D-ribitylamino)uracil phosphatase YigB [Photobacterium sp. ZSDE20]